MVTARTLISGALRLIGVYQPGEEPTQAQMISATRALNQMVDSWSNDYLSIHKVSPLYFNTAPGQQSYLLGPAEHNGEPTGADWVTTRPMQLQKAVLYQNLTSVDGTVSPNQSTITVPLDKLDYAGYADIRMRTLQSDPARTIFDDGGFPCRRLYIFPVPAYARAVELWLWQPLVNYDTLDDELSLPPGYERALRYNLAMELAPEYGRIPSQVVTRNAVDSHADVQRLNQRTTVPMRRDNRLAPVGSFNPILNTQPR
jgi:hypothetical protein